MEVRQVQLVRKLCSGGIQWFLFWQVDHWLPPESNGNLAGQFRAGFRVVVPMQTTGNETTEPLLSFTGSPGRLNQNISGSGILQYLVGLTSVFVYVVP